MIHLQNAATQMIEEFAKHGFNGVQFEDCRIEPARLDDWLSDGKAPEDHDAFIASYATFILTPDMPMPSRMPGDTRYDRAYFDFDQFDADLLKEMRRRFGEDVTIRFHEGCGEYEIERKE